jgi:hypothetical protein
MTERSDLQLQLAKAQQRQERDSIPAAADAHAPSAELGAVIASQQAEIIVLRRQVQETRTASAAAAATAAAAASEKRNSEMVALRETISSMASANTQLQGRLKALQAELQAVKESAACSGRNEAARLSAQDSLVRDLHDARQQLQVRDALVKQQAARISELEAAVVMWQKHQSVLLEQVVEAGNCSAKGAGGAAVSRAFDGGVSGRGDVSVLPDNWGIGVGSRSIARTNSVRQQQQQEQQQELLFPSDASPSVPPSRISFATFIALTQVLPTLSLI